MGNGVGIGAFVFSLILCLLNFIILPYLVWNAIAASAAAGTVANNAFTAAATFGLVLLILDIIGVVLGIIGIALSETKTFGILGLVFSIICLMFVLGAMAIGAYAVS